MVMSLSNLTYLKLFFLGKKPQKPVKFGAEIELLGIQIGGEADVSYIFDNGLFLELGFRYLYCYENVTSGVTIGAGYQSGGAR